MTISQRHDLNIIHLFFPAGTLFIGSVKVYYSHTYYFNRTNALASCSTERQQKLKQEEFKE
jgi:hypothetical protein